VRPASIRNLNIHGSLIMAVPIENVEGGPSGN
jgi:hypothetical protein